MRAIKGMAGQRFGRWVVIRDGFIQYSGGQRQPGWLCRCDCGTERVVSGYSLTSGDSKSCGCFNREEIIRRSTTHGDGGSTKAAEWITWRNMLSRCYNHRGGQYKDYGGRGITVCPEWHEYRNFLSDMGRRPPGLTLERIDNNKNYMPGNCRWATRSEQNRNMRSNVILTIAMVTLPLCDWAKELSIHPTTIRTRMKRGWSVADAILIPVGGAR